MREIKFRAWDKKGKEMLYKNDFSNIAITLEGYFMFWQNCEDGDFALDSFKEDFEIMQYTGIKDKNGKEIYEGDIIVISEENMIIGVGVVEFCANDECDYDRYCGFAILSNRPEDARFNSLTKMHAQYEAIGNIYENHELLGH